MEISFASKRLKEKCESQAKLQREHGQPCAKKLKARLADLEAASILADMKNAPGHCHELGGDRDGQLSIELSRATARTSRPGCYRDRA